MKTKRKKTSQTTHIEAKKSSYCHKETDIQLSNYSRKTVSENENQQNLPSETILSCVVAFRPANAYTTCVHKLGSKFSME